MFTKVLIANRGEIAVRIMRTLRDMGIASVAVYSDADAGAMHVREADEAVHIGPADARRSYLNIEAVISAATATGAEAIHPGYGFLAENAEFARACAAAGIVFIGPPIGAIETMGDKIAARAAVEARHVPTVPGIAEPGLDDAALIAGAERVGFPVLIKPSAGGGGKGMHRVDEPGGLADALAQARREAASAFGDDTLFVERFVTNPRHIEVQVLADSHGNVIHLGERECSLQRRHQKVIEEAPSALLNAEQRAAIGLQACETARSVGYVGAGTVEFIVSGDRPDEPFFMEMNTRLQVEHPVTEMVTGVDLVEQQLLVASGAALSISQEDIVLTGHAIEARIYAEDPSAGFLPTGGRLLSDEWPLNARIDTGVQANDVIGSQYDPMIAKLIVHADDRGGALQAMGQALAETHLPGIVTNVRFLRKLIAHPDVESGNLDTGLIDREVTNLTSDRIPDKAFAMRLLVHDRPMNVGAWAADGWRMGGVRGAVERYRDGDSFAEVTARSHGDSWECTVRRGDAVSTVTARNLVDYGANIDDRDDTFWALGPDGDFQIDRYRAPRRQRAGAVPGLSSPMPGTVVAVHVDNGASVAEGDAIVSIEAMKMEHVLRAPVAGSVTLDVVVGDTVKRGQDVAVVQPEGES